MPYPRQLDFDTRLALWIGEMLHRLRVWLEPPVDDRESKQMTNPSEAAGSES